MSTLQKVLLVLAAVTALAALLLPFASVGGTPSYALAFPAIAAFLVVTLAVLGWFRWSLHYAYPGALALVGGFLLLSILPGIEGGLAGYWFAVASVWLLAWLFAELLSWELRRGRASGQILAALVPLALGAVVLFSWEAITRAGNVPAVLLPAPSAIAAEFAAETAKLAADFQQTFMQSVLIGYAIGCGVGFLVAIAVDRSPFLRRGLLPIGNFVSALPLIGIAPILVMWFGFGWESKAAVVVVMTFFPMLVNTVAGLSQSSSIERDLMHTYAAGYWRTLFKLRLPAAAPFIFNALKINSTLALIGAIVAEFFGSPVVGMGFRMSSEIGKLNLDLVWAEIALAALAGSLFYFVVALVERAVTFWHPSVRGGRT